MTAPLTARSNLRQHFDDTVSHIKKFMWGCLLSPEVTINVVVSILACVFSLEVFSGMDTSDVIHFSDTSYLGEDTNFTVYPIAIVSDTDLITDSVCLDGDRLCTIAYPSEFHAGSSGIIARSFVSFNQYAFCVPHLLAAALWFTTPISLFLLANQTWNVFEQWMWWGLYLIILIWDVAGVFLLLFLNYAPVYNKVLVCVYCLYSFMLLFSVRETWMLRSATNPNNDDSFDRGRMDKDAAVPSFMKKLVLMNSSKKVYTLASNGDFETAEVMQDIPNGIPMDDMDRSALAPEVITHTFTRTVLLLCEFLFIAPVVYISAFVLVQERVIPMEVQVRFWQTSLMFGIVVLIEKSRKIRLSYVTDTVLSMAGLVSLLAVSWMLIPEIVRVLTGVPKELVPSSPGGVVLYCTFLLCYFVVIVNMVVSIVFVLFIGKDETLLTAFQNANASGVSTPNNKSKVLLVVNTMYYLNAISLCVVKVVLLVGLLLKWLDNRAW
jgi:hypothetical protein